MINLNNKISHLPQQKDNITYLSCLFIFIIFSSFFTNKAYAVLNRGLYFYSHESSIENKTSLTLNNNKPYFLKNKDIFSIDFEVQIRNTEAQRFGYIFKIISNKGESYNLVLNTKNEIFFVFDKQAKKEEFKKTSIGDEENLKVKITFDKNQNEINLQINNSKIIYKSSLQDIESLLVNFGECDIEGFKSNDVPPIIISDIKVIKNGKLKHHWLFDKYAGNVIYDVAEQKGAIFKNGKMLIDNSVHWQKIGSFKARKAPQITFDSINNQLLALDEQQLISFSIQNKKAEYTPMRNNPLDLLVNRFIYDYSSNKLLSYNFTPQRLNYFDSKTGSWAAPIDESHEFYHHNRYISLKDSSLYLYGGYGHYRYKGYLFKVNLKTGKWITKDLSSSIIPRYLASMGASKTGDKLYILGGKGAEMGLQELSPKNFFDLYEVDIKTLTPKLLYRNEEEQKKNLLFSNSLIVDDSNEFIYTLAYPAEKINSYFQLKKIGITHPSIEDYADSIKFFFKDDLSYCDLFFSPSLSKLIAVTTYSKDNVNSEVEIYSLDFPPLKSSDIHEIPLNKSSLRFIIIVIILAVLIASFIFLYRRKEKNSKNKKTEEITKTEQKEELFIEPSFTTKFYNRKKSSILFLGDFQVFDKNGKEITENFSPTLKYLLILILLYTTKNEKGISSAKLEEILWFGKSEKSAINNRNVNISKLRLLLDSFDNVEILNRHSYWSILLPDNVLSDYTEILNLTKQLKDNPNCDIEQIHRLLELLSYGELLPEIQYEWMDSFKSDFATLIIDTLLFIVKTENISISKDASTLLKITDTVFIFDPINEEAIKVKCKVLYNLGKKSLAKNAYENFSKRYYSLLGEEFNSSLKDMIE